MMATNKLTVLNTAVFFYSLCIIGALGARVPGFDPLKAPFTIRTSLNAASYSVLVTDYGAIGDGVFDNTKAFQTALNSVPNGGVVLVPSGSYRFNGGISIPSGVTLQGSYQIIPSHPLQGTPTVDGSILMPYSGRGNESGPAFISMTTNSALRGFSIFYPEQICGQLPLPYPWTVTMVGANPSITDVECLNCWNFISATQGGRHYIARVQGQPVNIGILVDSTVDIGRIEDAHFNPWFCANSAYMQWQIVHGRSFVFARSDWEYVLNTFSFGYAVGYHFTISSWGACNGNFLGIGTDMAPNASVLIEAAQPEGIAITNGEFTSFLGPGWGENPDADNTQVVMNQQNATWSGAVRFVNCAFWGPSKQVAQVDGYGLLSITDSNLMYWNAPHNGQYAVVMNGTGPLLLRGNIFAEDANQVYVSAQTTKAIISENFITGAERITLEKPGLHILVKDNIPDE